MPIPVRVKLLDGFSSWRMVPDLEHGTLSRVFNLDPVTTRFDLPRTAREPGSKQRVSGYVMRGERPIGTLHVAREGERFRDLDPTNVNDQLNLQETTG